jgi:hypothetical protein
VQEQLGPLRLHQSRPALIWSGHQATQESSGT